jgi:hypothetical protein
LDPPEGRAGAGDPVDLDHVDVTSDYGPVDASDEAVLVVQRGWLGGVGVTSTAVITSSSRATATSIEDGRPPYQPCAV